MSKSIPKVLKEIGKSHISYFKKELKLRPRQILFIAEYVSNGFNAGKAYTAIRKGKGKNTPGSAAVSGCLLLKNLNIQAGIRIILDEWLAEKKLKLDREIINVLYARAFYDPLMFLKDDGTPKFQTLEEIPQEWRCVVDGIEPRYFGKDADRKVVYIKLANRELALEKLSKYITLFKDTPIGELTISEQTAQKLSAIFRGGKPPKESQKETEEENGTE